MAWVAVARWCAVGGALAVGVLAASGAEPLRARLDPAEPMPVRLHTFNSNLLAAMAFRGITYGGAEFERGVRELKAVGLRFPGGTIANNYRWRTDSFSDPTNDKTRWAGEQIRIFRKMGLRYGLKGFAALCRRYRVEPIWVLNVYEETPESTVALMNRLEKLGLDVQAIELANEPYWDGRSLNDVAGYIRYCKPLVAALRAHDPALKVGACFAPLDRPANYEKIWNAPLAKEGWYDAAVFHEYYGGQGFELEKGDPVPVEAMLHPEAFFAEPVAVLTKLVPGKPIWLTEWNIGTKGLRQWKDRGAELLFLGASYCRIVEHREAIERACFHQIYGGRFGTFEWDKEAGKLVTKASYRLFRLLGAAFHGAETLRPTSLDDEDVLGFTAGGEGGLRMFVVNRGGEGRTLALPKEGFDNAAAWTIACPPEEKLPVSAELARRAPVKDARVELPARSVTLIAPPAAMEPLAPPGGAAESLFPVRPFFTLWVPPYATRQPRVDAAGAYTVDFAKLRDKPMAVAKMNVAALKLEPGRRYVLSFKAQADPAGGMVVHLPDAGRTRGGQAGADAGKAGGALTSLSGNARPYRFAFVYDPDAGKNEITFFFPKGTVAKGGKVVLSDFRLHPTE